MTYAYTPHVRRTSLSEQWSEPREGQNFQTSSFSSDEIVKTRFGNVLVEVVEREYASIEFPRLSVVERNAYVHGFVRDRKHFVLGPVWENQGREIAKQLKEDERKFSAVYVVQEGYLKPPTRYGIQLSALTILSNLENACRESQSHRELLQTTDKKKLVEAIANQLQVAYGNIFNIDIEVRIKERPATNKSQEPHT